MGATVVQWGGATARRRELEAELARVTPLLRGLPGVVEAWVFGSVVDGEVHATSDIDDAVLLAEHGRHATACFLA